MEKTPLIELFIAEGALRFGDFLLKSGRHSPVFIDLGAVASGHGLRLLARHYADAVVNNFPDVTILFGPAYKGISLATSTALVLADAFERSIKVCYNRKETKTHGEGGSYIGSIPGKTDRLVIVDDVVSSGETKREMIACLEADFSIQPIGIIVAIDRTQKPTDLLGYPLISLVTLADIRDFLLGKDDLRANIIDRFIREF